MKTTAKQSTSLAKVLEDSIFIHHEKTGHHD